MYPNGYLNMLCRLVGLPAGQVPDIVQPNIPPRTVDVDRAYRLTLPGPMVLHVEFESGHPRWRPERFLVYNVLLSRQERCPVKTVVVVLRPDADSPTLTGLHRVTLPTGEVVHEWRYSVVRLWELPPDTFMADLATMPLATLTNVPDDQVPALANRMMNEFLKLPTAERQELTVNSAILAGLRFDSIVAGQLFERVAQMRESSVYQEMLRECRAEVGLQVEIKRLIKMASKRCGAPDAPTLAALEAVTDEARLDDLYDRVEHVSSWAELLEP